MPRRVELDLRGKVCPEPYILALKEFAKLSKGDEMTVIMDSWKCAILLVESVKGMGLGEAKLKEEGENLYRVDLVKKAERTALPTTSSC